MYKKIVLLLFLLTNFAFLHCPRKRGDERRGKLTCLQMVINRLWWGRISFWGQKEVSLPRFKVVDGRRYFQSPTGSPTASPRLKREL